MYCGAGRLTNRKSATATSPGNRSRTASLSRPVATPGLDGTSYEVMVEPSPRPIRALALAGLAATWVALSVGYWLPGIGLPRMDVALWNGNLLEGLSCL